MTNCVPIIPQISQMTSYPAIPGQKPLIKHNPLFNPLCDISDRDRTIE